MELKELTLLSTDALLDELAGRYDAIIFMGIQEKTGKNTDDYKNDWRGGIARCLGLTEILRQKLLRAFKHEED